MVRFVIFVLLWRRWLVLCHHLKHLLPFLWTMRRTSHDWSGIARRSKTEVSMVRAFSAFRGPARQSLGAAAGGTIPPLWSPLRPISHDFDAVSVSLNLMRPLLGHDGLTAQYLRIAAFLPALAVPFFSKRARRIMVRASLGMGVFFGRAPAPSGSTGCAQPGTDLGLLSVLGGPQTRRWLMSKGWSVQFVTLASAKSAAGQVPRAICGTGAKKLFVAASSCL